MTEPSPGFEERARLVARSVTARTGELIDLGGRNTLLYYRDLKQGALDLSSGSGADEVAVETLLGGRSVRLSEMFDDTAQAAVARRARTVKAKAAENIEERGIQTMFLAWGMATWDNPATSATPSAPVLLRQAALSARGGAGEDFDLSLPGEWEVNPTLLHLLRVDYQVEVAADDLLAVYDEDVETPDPLALFDLLTKAGSALPGFAISPRVVIGNFFYATLPMVLDLENVTDTLVASDLIAAIAGDEAARDTVRARHPNVTVSEPDRVPPRDEFVVLDSDASQSYAINAALGGADLVVDGPPGTGKSQTIANLIATLAARGQRVLLVAEKRADFDAVLDRLNRVGLGDLVLDLHEGAGSKRQLASDLARASHSIGTQPRPDMNAAQEGLVRRRDDALVGHVDALHRPRDPWGVSVYDTQTRLLGVPPAAQSAQRLRGDALARLDAAGFRQAQADVEAFAGLSGFGLSAQTSPWGGALPASTLASPGSAQQALDAVTTLANHTLPDATARFGRALGECGLAAPDTIGAWVQVLQLLDGVNETLAVFEPDTFSQPLGELSVALSPVDKGALGRMGARP